MTFQPSTAEIDAAERLLIDGLGVGSHAADGYYRPLGEAIAIAIHEADSGDRARLEYAGYLQGLAAAAAHAEALVARASGLEPEYARCDKCAGQGDLFNGGWQRKPCDRCLSTGTVLSGAYVAMRSQPVDRAFALAVDSLHLIAADQAEGGPSFEAEGTLKEISAQMGTGPDHMYRLPSTRQGQEG